MRPRVEFDVDVRGFAILILVLILVTAPQNARAVVLVNNGLAPPNAANVLADDSLQILGETDLVVRNAGCPPGWPSGSVDAVCSSPGSATQYAIETGALIGSGGPGDPNNVHIRVHDSSSLVMDGGEVVGVLEALGSAQVAISGGEVGGVHCRGVGNANAAVSGGIIDGVVANDGCSIDVSGGSIVSVVFANYDGTAPVRISGGTVTGLVFGTGTTIAGANFELNGTPVPYGLLSGSSDALTGNLLLGGTVDVMIEGTLTLAPNLDTPAVPALGAASIPMLALAIAAVARRKLRG